MSILPLDIEESCSIEGWELARGNRILRSYAPGDSNHGCGDDNVMGIIDGDQDGNSYYHEDGWDISISTNYMINAKDQFTGNGDDLVCYDFFGSP